MKPHMLSRLPSNPPIGDDDRVLTDAPPEFWEPVIEHIRAAHGLPAGVWRRVARAKNVVFEAGERFVKLVPPYWETDARYEAAALGVVQGQLPVATPLLEASDTLDGWTVLVLGRIPGEPLADHWPALDGAQRVALMREVGHLAARLHALPIADPSPLAWDWAAQLAAQRADALAQRDTLPPPLGDRLAPFLESAGPLPTPDAPAVLLHGDLSAGNLLVRREADSWHLCGLIDWGDASAGQATHEFLSPAVNLLRGDAALLHALYDGYGLTAHEQGAALQGHLMARALLYYGWGYLGSLLPEPPASWDEVARFFWRMA